MEEDETEGEKKAGTCSAQGKAERRGKQKE